MSSIGSRSDDDLDPEYELSLRIAMERSKVETRGSSESATSLLPLSRLVLVPAAPARTHTPKSEARAARRERQRQRKRSEAEQSVHRLRGIAAELDEDARLLEWVYRRSLTTAETDARRLQQKNAKALRIAIEQFEREATETATDASRLAKLKWEQDREVLRLKGLVILSDDDHDDLGSSSDDSFDSPPTTDSYSCAGDQKGKGSARKWRLSRLCLRFTYVLASL
ncbi:Phosphorylated carbohydrates phosphatase [Hordeum vulgare]|nr:Phosphorylated carbohydrates phosphatase [Hordeum vulgare]